MPDLWATLGLIVTVISLIYAIYQGIKSKQLKNLIHSQTWDLHARANNATGAVQTAFTKYKEKYKENLDPEVLEVFSKSAAFNQDLFLDTIRHIYLSEPFGYDTVEKWIETGKLDKNYKMQFNLIANLETKNPDLLGKVRKFL